MSDRSGIYTGGVESIIKATIAEEQAPITRAQFVEYKQMMDYVVNLLQQQLFSMDIALSVFMERVVPENEREAFKAEIATRVKALADDMVRKNQEAERKIHLA